VNTLYAYEKKLYRSVLLKMQQNLGRGNLDVKTIKIERMLCNGGVSVYVECALVNNS